MRKSASLTIAASALLLLPLMGCSASDSDSVKSTNETSAAPESSATEESSTDAGSVDWSEPLTEEITAANQDGTAEVTIMGPQSWYSWGPGDVVKHGQILFTELGVDDLWFSVQVWDGWPNGCTPENVSTQQCDVFGVDYLGYKALESVTIDGYDAPGFEYVADYDSYKTREQHRLLDIDGAPMAVVVATSAIDEDFPQLLFDIRDSLTVKFVS